jgi:prophage endopeptidase
MTQDQLKVIGVILVALALVAVGAAGAWLWQANAYGKVIASNEAARQADIALLATAGAKQAREALDKQRDAERALADLDTKHLQETDALNAKNEDLRRAVADGTRRLRIAGSCRASGGNVSGTATASSLGDEGAVELSAAAGQTVFDIRAGIIADQTALKAAQDYIREVCHRP